MVDLSQDRTRGARFGSGNHGGMMSLTDMECFRIEWAGTKFPDWRCRAATLFDSRWRIFRICRAKSVAGAGFEPAIPRTGMMMLGRDAARSDYRSSNLPDFSRELVAGAGFEPATSRL